jgi:hypothetical protein
MFAGLGCNKKVILLSTRHHPVWDKSPQGYWKERDLKCSQLQKQAQFYDEVKNLDYPTLGIGIYTSQHGNPKFSYLIIENYGIQEDPANNDERINFYFRKVGDSIRTSQDLINDLPTSNKFPSTTSSVPFFISTIDITNLLSILQNLGEIPPKAWEIFCLSELLKSVGKFNIFYDITILEKFYYSINSGNKFVILSGPTGTGKTLLGMIYAYIKSQNQAAFQVKNLPDFSQLVNVSYNESELKEGLMKNPYLCFVRVQPNWVSPKDIIGYYNPFSNRFIEGQIFYLLYYASKDKNNNYFLILDEMNLSHPEWYLSDIISAMETGGKIYIHDKIIPYPKNLFIIGTINLDETTKELSPRLKSRAFYIEMRANFDNYISKCNDNKEKEIAQILKVIDENLKTIGLGLGYRDIKHIKEYVENGGEISDALIAKIIPRIRTTDEEIKNVIDEIIENLDNLGLKEFKNEDFKEFIEELENLKRKFEKYGYI